MEYSKFFQQSRVFFVRSEQHICLIFENMVVNKIYAKLLFPGPFFY